MQNFFSLVYSAFLELHHSSRHWYYFFHMTSGSRKIHVLVVQCFASFIWQSEIAHFRVALSLSIKARAGAQPFI